MNFLMRSTTNVHSERTPIPGPRVDTRPRSASGSSLETLVSQDSYARNGDDAIITGMNSNLPIVPDKHVDVSAEEGWITIPCSMCNVFTLTNEFNFDAFSV